MLRNSFPLVAALAWAVFSSAATRAEQPTGNHIADQATYLNSIKTLLIKEWPGNRTVQIVCHGHSVPAGYFKTPVVDTFNSYPHLLHRKLNTLYPYAVINVVVTAIGGENSESGAKRFARDVVPLRPDVVTIDYGLNDRGIGLDRALKAWTEMITQAKAINSKIILLTPTADVRAKLDNPNDPLNQHAAQIRRLAAQHQVALVDSLAMFHDFVKSGGKLADLMSQVNHPNRKGHEMVADNLILWFSKR